MEPPAMENVSVEHDFHDLPEDLVFKEILTKVPAKSILRMKSVSKSWRNHIASDSAFIADHAARHSAAATTGDASVILGLYGHDKDRLGGLYFLAHDDSKLFVEIDMSYIRQAIRNPEKLYDIELAGSCNGLVGLCLRSYYSKRDELPLTSFSYLVVWNPVTREFRYLPEANPPPDACEGRKNFLACYYLGFGKDDYNNYKVVRLQSFDCDDDNVQTVDVQLFTKNTGRWRSLNCLSVFQYLAGNGLTLDGTMHWAIWYLTPNRNGRPRRILSFDIRDEEFRELDGPACLTDEEFEDMELFKWKGSLGAVLAKPGGVQWQVWHYDKKSESNDFSWRMITIVDLSMRLRYYGLYMNRLVLSSKSCFEPFAFDLIGHETVKFEGGKLYFFNVFDHVYTLMSPC